MSVCNKVQTKRKPPVTAHELEDAPTATLRAPTEEVAYATLGTINIASAERTRAMYPLVYHHNQQC